MQPVVSSEQMRWCDEATISKIGVPGLLLMDRAGTAASHLILKSYPPRPGDVVAVICGKGNNGGDGFVIGRVLAEHGYDVRVALTTSATSLKGDAATHFGFLLQTSKLRGSRISISSFSRFARNVPPQLSLVVDAVFGTGFRGIPRGDSKKAIGWMRSIDTPVVAVDVPSGIDATSGTADGVHVSADLTITFGLLKSGLLLNEGGDHAGHVSCVDIGIPGGISRRARKVAYLVERSDVCSQLPKRPRRSHKYSSGKVLVVAGCRGLTGAASLASHAALRSGAGAVVLMVPKAIYPIMARKRTEEIVTPVPSTPQGAFGEESVADVLAKLPWADVLLIGPGIGLNEGTARFLEKVLSVHDGPAVVDADALTLVARSGKLTSLLRRRDWILTPHVGEFDRFVGIGSAQVEKLRIAVARDFVRRKTCTLLLKGAPTVVASSSGDCFVNPTGNPGMATVGSGDVLSGCLAALRAQGLGSAEAAYSAAFLHGRAGDLARDMLGERSVVASDLHQYLPVAFRECVE